MPSIDDLFPESPRQLYSRAPDVLVKVACEFRYPRILRLDTEPPASFQEALFKTFPLYERTASISLPEGMQIPQEVLQLVASQGGSSGHQFLTEDRGTTVTLSSQNMILEISGAAYTKWEEFRAVIEIAEKSLISNYKVPFYTRIGLRYQDIIHPHLLGLPSDYSWSSLIKPELLGKWPFADFENCVTGATHRLNMNLPDSSGSLILRHGLVIVAGKGRGYMIDLDFFSPQPKIETKDVFHKLNHFHKLAGRAFRWCITNDLRSAMGPSGELPSD